MPTQGADAADSHCQQCVYHQHPIIPCPQAPPPTRFLCLSASVFWLYHGSSRKGSLCHTYLRTVLMSALLMRMHRYTTRNMFIDLKHKTVMETERLFPRSPELGVSFLGMSTWRADGNNTAKVLEGPPTNCQSGKGKLVYI